MEPLPGAVTMEASGQRPAGATSTGDGEPLPGAEKMEATTRHRPVGATKKTSINKIISYIKTEMSVFDIAQ